MILPGAAALPLEEFSSRVEAAYLDLLDGIELERIFRIWNFIPRIDQPGHDGVNRYMHFNAGRHAAFKHHSGGRAYPPASGVGHAGDDLVVHLLEGARSIEVVKNQRQVPPNEYSLRWGPLPPVFCRAAVTTLHDDTRLLVVSGTASVQGEDSAHTGDLDAQLEETFVNLEALFENAGVEQLRLDSMLVYVKHHHDVQQVRARSERALHEGRGDLEIRTGNLCRDELLVEIEGYCILEEDSPISINGRPEDG